MKKQFFIFLVGIFALISTSCDLGIFTEKTKETEETYSISSSATIKIKNLTSIDPLTVTVNGEKKPVSSKSEETWTITWSDNNSKEVAILAPAASYSKKIILNNNDNRSFEIIPHSATVKVKNLTSIDPLTVTVNGEGKPVAYDSEATWTITWIGSTSKKVTISAPDAFYSKSVTLWNGDSKDFEIIPHSATIKVKNLTSIDPLTVTVNGEKVTVNGEEKQVSSKSEETWTITWLDSTSKKVTISALDASYSKSVTLWNGDSKDFEIIPHSATIKIKNLTTIDPLTVTVNGEEKPVAYDSEAEWIISWFGGTSKEVTISASEVSYSKSVTLWNGDSKDFEIISSSATIKVKNLTSINPLTVIVNDESKSVAYDSEAEWIISWLGNTNKTVAISASEVSYSKTISLSNGDNKSFEIISLSATINVKNSTTTDPLTVTVDGKSESVSKNSDKTWTITWTGNSTNTSKEVTISAPEVSYSETTTISNGENESFEIISYSATIKVKNLTTTDPLTVTVDGDTKSVSKNSDKTWTITWADSAIDTSKKVTISAPDVSYSETITINDGDNKSHEIIVFTGYLTIENKTGSSQYITIEDVEKLIGRNESATWTITWATSYDFLSSKLVFVYGRGGQGFLGSVRVVHNKETIAPLEPK